jgi:predicted nucleic acid-binding protein
VTHFVLDASTVLTWCFPDEESQRTEQVAERIAGGERATVPPFWFHEILNALLVGERRKRLTRPLTEEFLDDLARLPLDIDPVGTPAKVFGTTQTLCRKHGLTSYDAAYLEIALRGSCAIATVDDDLRRAAIAEGVPVI